MPRYYVSFAFPGNDGLTIASLDVTMKNPINAENDLGPVYELLADRGFRTNVKILAFSPYTDTPAATPHTTTTPAAPQHPRRRPGRPA